MRSLSGPLFDLRAVWKDTHSKATSTGLVVEEPPCANASGVAGIKPGPQVSKGQRTGVFVVADALRVNDSWPATDS